MGHCMHGKVGRRLERLEARVAEDAHACHRSGPFLRVIWPDGKVHFDELDLTSSPGLAARRPSSEGIPLQRQGSSRQRPSERASITIPWRASLSQRQEHQATPSSDTTVTIQRRRHVKLRRHTETQPNHLQESMKAKVSPWPKASCLEISWIVAETVIRRRPECSSYTADNTSEEGGAGSLVRQTNGEREMGISRSSKRGSSLQSKR